MNDIDIDSQPRNGAQAPQPTDEELQANLASIINSAAAAHLASEANSTAHKATSLKLRVIQLGADGAEPAFPTQH